MAVMSPEAARQICGFASSLVDATELQRALRGNYDVIVYVTSPTDKDLEADRIEVMRGTSLRRALEDAAGASITQYCQMIHDAVEDQHG